jgi:tRNA(Phe) wybutosine-synthesizing methylase Tyw3
VHIEIFGTHHMSVPVKSGKKVLVEKAYVKELVKLANKKWKKNHETLKKLCAALKKELR